MEMKNVFVFLLVILGVCSLANGLRCYCCDNFTDANKDCSKIASSVECEATCDGVCSKSTISGVVIKGCLKKNLFINKQLGCKKAGETENCFCGGDLCNSAVTIKSFQMLFACIILVPVLTSYLS